MKYLTQKIEITEREKCYHGLAMQVVKNKYWRALESGWVFQVLVASHITSVPRVSKTKLPQPFSSSNSTWYFAAKLGLLGSTGASKATNRVKSI